MTTRNLLVIAIVFSVYLVYLVGAAVMISMNVHIFVLPFWSWPWLSPPDLGVILDWVAGLTMALWIYWGLRGSSTKSSAKE